MDRQKFDLCNRIGVMALSRFAKSSVLAPACLVTAALAIGIIGPANAVPTITTPGSLMDLGAAWRTGSVSKDGLDLDGNGVLGNDGYWTFGANASALQPSYISGVAIAASVYAGNGLFARIDNPSTTPGPSPTTYTSGTLNPFVDGVYTDFSFTLSGDVPGLIRIGLMIDNLHDASYNPSALQIVDTTDDVSGPLIATTSAAFNDGNPDWVFFDIAGGSAGDEFAVEVYAGSVGCNCLGAISFDSASVNTAGPVSGSISLVEPNSGALLGFGLVGLLATTRRRRAQHVR